jgi:hypothetical protein
MTVIFQQQSSTPAPLTNGGMSFLTIVTRLCQNCGVTPPSSVVAQTGESLRMVNFANEAWMDIQAQRADWQWMRKSIAFQTVAGQSTYTPTQTGATDFSSWDRDSFRNYANPAITVTVASPCVATLSSHRLATGDTVTFATTGALPTGITAGVAYYVLSVPTANTFTFSAVLSGTAVNTSGTQSGTHSITSSNTDAFVGFNSEIFMEYMDFDAWRDTYQISAIRQIETRPTDMTITANKSIGLGPSPINGYTIVGDYYSVPTEMALDTEAPLLPAKFHFAIIYRAMMAYGAYEAASEVYQRGETEFNKWMRRIYADNLSEITSGGALC